TRVESARAGRASGPARRRASPGRSGRAPGPARGPAPRRRPATARRTVARSRGTDQTGYRTIASAENPPHTEGPARPRPSRTSRSTMITRWAEAFHAADRAGLGAPSVTEVAPGTSVLSGRPGLGIEARPPVAAPAPIALARPS